MAPDDRSYDQSWNSATDNVGRRMGSDLNHRNISTFYNVSEQSIGGTTGRMVARPVLNMTIDLKPQSHQADDQVTTNEKVESWANRRKNVRLVAEVVRLVAEVVGDRKGQISRSKVVLMFKTQSHRAYDQVTTYLRSKNV